MLADEERLYLCLKSRRSRRESLDLSLLVDFRLDDTWFNSLIIGVSIPRHAMHRKSSIIEDL